MIRAANRTAQIVIDLFLLSSAFWLAFLLRFDWAIPYEHFKRALFLWPYVVFFQFSLLFFFGVTQFSWRYVGLREASRILIATGASFAVLLLVRLVSGAVLQDVAYAKFAHIPLGVILIDFMLAFLGTAGIRALRRIMVERTQAASRRPQQKYQVPTMLIGAGQAGVMVAKELISRPDLGMLAVGFVDDDPIKVGSVIHGIRVLGTTDQLAALCHEHKAEQVLITIANAPGKSIREITRLAEETGLSVKIIPGIYEIVGGQVNLSRIRDVAIEDLLGREPVNLDEDLIRAAVRDRVVLVTGAGGSIGSELCRQICRFGPKRLVLVEQFENNLFYIHKELGETSSAVPTEPCVADICDSKRIERIFDEHRPQVVYHAAAHKHVPMMEWNAGEAIKNNVFGTRKVADLADRFGAEKFVMISTDKAVNPTSLMGVSKRVAEIYTQALSQRSKTQFITVRFGNVLGSAGSVIPIFKKQIEKGGPVTVTDPEMQRYFMTIPEACQLVVQAGAMGEGGEIFVLDMGEPVKIVDLARDLIRLSGFREGEDIEIVFTGMRPGEKLFEELSVDTEQANKTRHPKIFIGHCRAYPWGDVERHLAELHEVSDASDLSMIREQFVKAVPEYKP